MLCYIEWDISPIIFSLGKFSFRWYSLMISGGFLLGYFIIKKMFEKENIPEKDFTKFVQYLFFSTIIGLRLGHCFFYDPIHYLTHPLEILKVWEGGLASHGAATGILIGMFLYVRKYKKSFIWLLDRIIIIVCIIGAMVRIGNLMNSEIIGSPTDSKKAFLFVNPVNKYVVRKQADVFTDSRVSQLNKDTVVDGITYTKLKLEIDFFNKYENKDVQDYLMKSIPSLLKQKKSMKSNLKLFSKPEISFEKNKASKTAVLNIWAIPRFPSQLFESLFYAMLFVIYFTLYRRKKGKLIGGVFFSSFMIALFVFRFIIEFIKKEQVDFESAMLFNMGQLLSLPFIIAGILLLIYSLKQNKELTFYKNIKK